MADGVATDLVTVRGEVVQLRPGQISRLVDGRRVDVESADHPVVLQQLLRGHLVGRAVVEGQGDGERMGRRRLRGGRRQGCDGGPPASTPTEYQQVTAPVADPLHGCPHGRAPCVEEYGRTMSPCTFEPRRTSSRFPTDARMWTERPPRIDSGQSVIFADDSEAHPGKESNLTCLFPWSHRTVLIDASPEWAIVDPSYGPFTGVPGRRNTRCCAHRCRSAPISEGTEAWDQRRCPVRTAAINDRTMAGHRPVRK